MTIFEKIISGEVSCTKVYEDDSTLAFLDNHPVTVGHTLVIPKTHYPTFIETSPEALQAAIQTCQKVAQALYKIEGVTGVNIKLNNGASAGQTVFHTHFHVIPRYDDDGLESWPGNEIGQAEEDQIAQKLRENLSK